MNLVSTLSLKVKPYGMILMVTLILVISTKLTHGDSVNMMLKLTDGLLDLVSPLKKHVVFAEEEAVLNQLFNQP